MSDERPIPEMPAPELFADVVGQPAAVAALRVAARNPVHAYLFQGVAGAGPRAAARAFAAALLCRHGGCNHCTDCRRALAGTHPDLVWIERTGASLSVEDARHLVGLAARRPYEAERQVLVVNDVHLASRSAPALLKTVEEPSPSTVFVLLAEDLPPELATVASRCVLVSFPPVPASVVESWLVERGIEPSRAAAVAEGSGGDLDRARLLAEDEGYGERAALWRAVPGRLDGSGAVAGELARALLAATESALAPLREQHARELERLGQEAESLGERGIPGRKDIVDRQSREERRWRTDELRSGLGVLARTYRDRLADAARPSRSAASPVAGSVAGPRTGSPAGPVESIEAITEASASLRRNPNETLLLEALLVRLASTQH